VINIGGNKRSLNQIGVACLDRMRFDNVDDDNDDDNNADDDDEDEDDDGYFVTLA